MSLALSGIRAVYGVHREHLLQQAFQLVTQVVHLLITAGFDLVEDFFTSFTLEWKLANYKHVQNAGERPDVALMRVVAVEYFRCHEVRSARVRLHMMLRILGQSKINQTNFAVLSVHDVFRLDITVSDSEGVAMLQSLEALVDDFSCFALCIWLALLEIRFVAVKELSARAELHD